MALVFHSASSFNQDLGWCLGLEVDYRIAFENNACSVSSCGVTFSDSCPTAAPAATPTAMPTEAPSKLSEHPCTNKTWNKTKKKWNPRECRWARKSVCSKKKKSSKCKIFKRAFFKRK
jgi:hypothetical protein